MAEKLKRILSKDKKIIIISTIVFLLGLFLTTFQNNLELKFIGVLAIIFALYYVKKEELISPIKLVGSFFALSIVIVQGGVLFLGDDFFIMTFFISIGFSMYFLILALGYFHGIPNGLFITSFLITAIYVILNYILIMQEVIVANNIRLISFVVYTIFVVIAFFVAKKIKKSVYYKEGGKSVLSNKN